MRDREEGRLFFQYINKLRDRRGRPISEVCEGLCTPQEMSHLESGNRLPCKLLQDAIIERLGTGAEDYEHFLGYEEYDRWLARQNILHSITFEKPEQAERLLEEYYARYGDNTRKTVSRTSHSVENRLERQFYLSMRAQIRRCRGASKEELLLLFQEALLLTVPEPKQKPLTERILSIKELNLILETEQYQAGGPQPARYREVLNYLESAGLDNRGMAKIYPKAAVFLCRSLPVEKKVPALSELTELFRVCNRALDILRNNQRMYYLWEILDLRNTLLEQIMRQLEIQGQPKKAHSLNALYQENRQWKEMLEGIYEEYGVQKETFDFCYLYVLKGVSCINDVIRIRRQMLEITPRELCDGICDVKTLRRLEHRKTVPQRAIVMDLFERLGLPRELTRTELVTSDPTVRAMMEKLRTLMNAREYETAEKILEEIKALTPMDIRANRQTLEDKKLLIQRKQKKISFDEFYQGMRQVLEWTMPFDAFFTKGEKYLTHEELTCIYHMQQGKQEEDEELGACLKQFEALYLPMVNTGLQDAFSGMFEFIISSVASRLGNRGEFDLSDHYSDLIIQGCLRFRRLGALHDSLYSRWWNYNEQKRRNLPLNKTLDDERELNRCIQLSRLYKGEYDEIFYCTKLDRITKNR